MHRRTIRTMFAVALALATVGASGCLTPRPHLSARHDTPPINLPAPGSVPTELNPVTLPEYVIEPPDVLVIEAQIKLTDAGTKIADLRTKLRAAKTDEEKQKVEKELADAAAEARFTGETRPLPYNPIQNQFQVRPDGTVYLGAYGTVQVAGLTLDQARRAIRSVLARQIDYPDGVKEDAVLVLVDAASYNSKSYYVITDGAGAGERVGEFPITGKEFVTTAIARIGGLPEEASKRNIWVARRTPQLNEEQILPVDWVGITQWGVTSTNYQLFPGDRVYVKAQRIVTVDRTLAKLLNPVERLLGVSLLGTQTYNQIAGRGFGFGGGGFGN
ncbi:MAG: polysaccharide biosynthesis/export family protein [Fimbriiglobus sp.]|nr:polysaccharide biosynthesis/export family protein [Fimbriiglobus sp.]